MTSGFGIQPAARHTPDHEALRSLLGAWALHACSPEEAASVERHLRECGPCSDEACRLRDAVRWLSPDDPLDPDPLMRVRVLETCLGRRPAQVPVPDWAAPYNAETARLDALLRDLGEDEWGTGVKLVWHSGARELSVPAVLGHLAAVDGLVSTTLGLTDPLGPTGPRDPVSRTDALAELDQRRSPADVRASWRDQTHTIVRTAAFAGEGASGLGVDYGAFTMPMRDSLLDRAFECWIHADDIANAVDYPYDPPAAEHLRPMIDLTARAVPAAVAALRRQGMATSPGRLVAAGAPGRALELEIEGPGGGIWLVPLDSPTDDASPDGSVAHIALDSVDFCQLAAGHVDPERIAVGVDGDPEAVHDVLHAVASLSRL